MLHYLRRWRSRKSRLNLCATWPDTLRLTFDVPQRCAAGWLQFERPRIQRQKRCLFVGPRPAWGAESSCCRCRVPGCPRAALEDAKNKATVVEKIFAGSPKMQPSTYVNTQSPVIFPIAVPILPLGSLGASNKKAGSPQRLFRISHVVPHLTGETLQLCPGLFTSRNHQRAKLILHSSGLPAALYVLCSLGASNTVCGKGDLTKEVGVRYPFKPRALVYYFHQPMGFTPWSINFFLFLC